MPSLRIKLFVRSQFTWVIATTLACAWAVFGAGPVALRAAEPPANAVTLQLVLERSLWSLHEPVLVTLEAVNSSSSPISLDLGRDFKGNLRVVFTEPGGQVTVGGLPELPDGLYLPGTMKLTPGQTYREPLVLNDWQ